MRYVSAYLLAVLGGKDTPSVADLETIISSVGIDFDAEQAKAVVSKCQGKSVEELIAQGSSSLVSVSAGAAVAAPAAGGAPPPLLPPRRRRRRRRRKSPTMTWASDFSTKYSSPLLIVVVSLIVVEYNNNVVADTYLFRPTAWLCLY
ncbi:hypothetical protein L596_005654 [Steinernema carpocapsae]|uniref:Large ribosomal subunit protein P2 n=1 Tax=Steinernema carpocapsae TaxID=34508 RepID=A0A4U8V4Z5_STECR|nr:hypothetical protein L596_005654 [Steinernema carpocapsae]